MAWRALLACAALAACSDAAPKTVSCQGDPMTPIGGAFSLVDQTGRPTGADALAGRHSLIYFGFTYCPDVCPTEMHKISLALQALRERGEDLSKLQPVFFSVDPERDTPDVVEDYLTLYDPSFLGLTGTPDQVRQAAEQYRVYYAKEGEGEYYTVNHASLIYFMGPDGHYVDHFTAEDDAVAIADRVGACL